MKVWKVRFTGREDKTLIAYGALERFFEGNPKLANEIQEMKLENICGSD
jgi:hypothetical protein